MFNSNNSGSSFNSSQPNKNPYSFGSTNTTPSFTSGAFSTGTPPTNTATGTASMGFGSFGKTGTTSFGQTNTGTSSFGSTNPTTASFGSINPSASSFGQPNTGASTFGQQNTGASTFGQPNTGASTFGQTNNANSGFFGLGSSAATNPAASSIGTNPIGANSSGFSGSFGANANTGSMFGGSSFGTAPAAAANSFGFSGGLTSGVASTGLGSTGVNSGGLFGGSFGTGFAASKGIAAEHCPNNVSAVKFTEQDFCLATSWDGYVCVYKANQNSLDLQFNTRFEAPVLDADWTGNSIATGCGDKNGYLWDVGANQKRQFARHDAPISKVRAFKESNSILITGSWDCSVRYWDSRKIGETMVCKLPERVYSIDTRGYILVVCTAGKQIHFFDMRNPNAPVRTMPSPLRTETRCVQIFKENDGIAVGSLEGRIAINYFANEEKNFAFKAHRETHPTTGQELANPLNAFAVHPKANALASCSSDGVISCWDKNGKRLIHSYPKQNQPVVDIDFNAEGTLLVYALSNDYHKGKETVQQNQPSKIYVQKVQQSDVIKA